MTAPDELAVTITAALGDTYQVLTTAQGWIEVRVNPATALRDRLDFLRVVIDDYSHFRLIHLTHNEVLKGGATFSNSLAAYLPAMVREFCDTQF